MYASYLVQTCLQKMKFTLKPWRSDRMTHHCNMLVKLLQAHNMPAQQNFNAFNCCQGYWFKILQLLLCIFAIRSVSVKGGSKIHKLLDLMCCKMLLMSKPWANAVLLFLISSPAADSFELFTSKSVPLVPFWVNLAVSTTCKQPCTWVSLLLAQGTESLSHMCLHKSWHTAIPCNANVKCRHWLEGRVLCDYRVVLSASRVQLTPVAYWQFCIRMLQSSCLGIHITRHNAETCA